MEGSYLAVVLMALVLLPWLSSVSAKQPKIYEHIQTHSEHEQVLFESQ